MYSYDELYSQSLNRIVDQIENAKRELAVSCRSLFEEKEADLRVCWHAFTVATGINLPKDRIDEWEMKLDPEMALAFDGYYL